MHISKLQDLERFTTLDGSTIREIAGPAWTPARNQSLAEATVPVGGATAAHYHREAEELYFFTAGTGRLRLGDDERDVEAGDCVVIPPGTVHKLWNTGDGRSCSCAAAPPPTPTRTPCSWKTAPPRLGPAGPCRCAASFRACSSPWPPCSPLRPPASALTVGIADQKADMFIDPRFERADHARAPHRRLGRADEPVADRGARHVDGRRARRRRRPAASRSAHSRDQPPELPTPERLLFEFRRFRARYPWVKEFATWNEANHCGEPTCHRPRLVAAYYRKMRRSARLPDPRRRAPRHAEHGRWVQARSATRRRGAEGTGGCTTTSTPTACGRPARAGC